MGKCGYQVNLIVPLALSRLGRCVHIGVNKQIMTYVSVQVLQEADVKAGLEVEKVS